MISPKISIITITYNSEKTVEETIQSIVNQNYNNIEYIIIDGKSTDSTLSIIEKYKNKIDKVISEPDKGISDAFNKGIKHSTGEIIGIINSDDLLLPGALNMIANNYSKDIDVYRSNLIIWNDKTEKRYRAIPSMKFPLYKLGLDICHPSTFISINAYKKWGLYNLKYKYMMDVDLLTRFYNKKANMKYLDYDAAIFRLGGITDSSINSKLKEIEYVVIDNNGNFLLSKVKVLCFIMYKYLKKTIDTLFGDNIIKNKKYQKTTSFSNEL